MRKERLESLWRDRLERAAHSHLTVRAFCKQEGVTEQRYYAWKNRLAERDYKAEFVEVQPAPAQQQQATMPFELFVPGGLVVRVPPKFDGEALKRLIDTLTSS